VLYELSTQIGIFAIFILYHSLCTVRIPCDRMFFAHYEQVLADPSAYRNALSQFFELNSAQRDVIIIQLYVQINSFIWSLFIVVNYCSLCLLFLNPHMLENDAWLIIHHRQARKFWKTNKFFSFESLTLWMKCLSMLLNVL